MSTRVCNCSNASLSHHTGVRAKLVINFVLFGKKTVLFPLVNAFLFNKLWSLLNLLKNIYCVHKSKTKSSTGKLCGKTFRKSIRFLIGQYLHLKIMVFLFAEFVFINLCFPTFKFLFAVNTSYLKAQENRCKVQKHNLAMKEVFRLVIQKHQRA